MLKHYKYLVFLLAVVLSITSKVYCQESDIDSAYFNDGHSHMGLVLKDNRIEYHDIDYLKDRKIESLIFSLPVDRSVRDNLYEKLDREMQMLDSLFLISNTGKNNLKINFCIEYFHGLGGYKANSFKRLSDFGIKYITLIDSEKFELFENDQLNKNGKDIINKLNKANIAIDITHLTENQIYSVIEYSKQAVIASHTCAKGVTDLSYNISDELIKIIAEKNGMVMNSFNKNGLFNKNESQVDGIKRFCKHLDYVVNIIGIEHVGIGTDLQANGAYVPKDMNGTNVIPKIRDTLLNMGYSYNQIEKVFYKNLEDFF